MDYGTVRLGVAISDPERRIATPLEIHTRQNAAADATYFVKLVAAERIARFVVGLPVHLDGRENQKSSEARQFATWLFQTTGIPVDLFDERFTTAQADEHLLAAGLTKKKRKARRDMLAAQILLAAYLESGCQNQDDPGGIG